MGMLGYLKDGVYISAVPGQDKPPIQAENPQFKAGDHERQRKDFAREILQPFNRDGSVSEDFVNAYPEIAKERGFIPPIGEE